VYAADADQLRVETFTVFTDTSGADWGASRSNDRNSPTEYRPTDQVAEHP
jgi:hypothetical protein